MRSLALAMVVAAAAPGCALPEQRADFDSVDPQERVLATLEAQHKGDRSAVPLLIGQLDSEDPAQRMLAIRALQRLTGQTLGYEHSGSERERRDAISRWDEWYRDTSGATGEPGAPPIASEQPSS